MKNLKNLVNKKVIAVMAIVMTLIIAFTFAGGDKVLKINGVAVSTSEGVPFDSNGFTFVPVGVITQKMGGTYTFNEAQSTATIKSKEGKSITLTVGKSVAVVDGKTVPVYTKVVKGVTVPLNVKPILKNHLLYVPVEFVQNVLGYPVTKVTENGATVIYVGTIPSTVKPQTPSNSGGSSNTTPSNSGGSSNTTPSKPSTPSNSGSSSSSTEWTCPQIKSTSTGNVDADLVTLHNELGFGSSSGWAGYSVYMDNPTYVTPTQLNVSKLMNKTFNAQIRIQISQWANSANVKNSNRIQPIAEQMFKFYFPNGYQTMLSDINTIYYGTDAQAYALLDHVVTIDGREILFTCPDSSLLIYISAPGEHINK